MISLQCVQRAIHFTGLCTHCKPMVSSLHKINAGHKLVLMVLNGYLVILVQNMFSLLMTEMFYCENVHGWCTVQIMTETF